MKQNRSHEHPSTLTKHHETVTVLYYIARYLSVFLLIGLCIISTLYAVGNLVTIQAENFTCPQYTEEEVRKFNYLKGDPNGMSDSCYYIDSERLNFAAIYDLDISIYTASFADDIRIFNTTLFIFYSLIALISVILTIYHGYFLLYDSYCLSVVCCNCPNAKSKMNPRFKRIVETCSKSYHRAKTKHKRQGNTSSGNRKKNTQKVKSQSNVQKCLQCVSNGINDYTQFMSDNFYFDSKYWLFGIIIREFFEIIIQFYALLLYGGMNLFDLNENVLSQEGYIVEGMNLFPQDFKVMCALNLFLVLF